MNRDDLYHYGVLGMKWGVRRYQPYERTGRVRRKSSLRNRFERNAGKRSTNTLREARSRDINELSTRELKEYNDRLQAEENYKRLTEGSIARGRKWLLAAGATILTAVTVDVIKSQGKKWVTKKYPGWISGAKSVFTRPKATAQYTSVF